MAEKNYKTVAVVPEMPRTIDEQQLHVYVPVGSVGNYGVFKPDGQQFVIVNGVLRVDASKLIQLADPPAIVTEDGGPVGVDIEFTEADSTLNRKFQFTFKNIKGATGETGGTGLSALQTIYTWTAFSKPVIGTETGTQNSQFSRTPVVGDTFIAVYRHLAADLKTILGVYLVYCEITSVAEVTTSCNFKLVKWQEIPIKYITQIIGPVTAGLNDTYTIVFSDGTTHDFVVTNGAQGEQGPTGPTGEQGPKGDDGVSITSVTQTGIDGGTRVTITMSDGQSTSFDVTNGINTQFKVVDKLPTTDISTSTIYLVPSATPGVENVYDEYIYVNGNWEHIGSTNVDLSDYVTKTYFNQNVGDATKNYIAAQLAKVHNLYIEMYESGSVPAVGQALTLTNANFARVPAADQYFGLLEVVNTKDKYYSVCKILSVDTTTCSAKVVAVTELDSGTEIDDIKASVDAKLDKVTGATNYPQVYAKNADGTQAMLNVGGTADDDIATVKQVNDAQPYHITLTSYSGKVTQEQYDKLKADDRSYVIFSPVNVVLTKGKQKLQYYAITGNSMYSLLISDSLLFLCKTIGIEDTAYKKTSIVDGGNNTDYPTTKAVADYVAANAPSAYHINLEGTSGTLTDDEYNKLKADNRSYIVTSTGKVLYYVTTTSGVLGYAAMYEDGLTVVTINTDYSYVEQTTEVGGEAYHIELSGDSGTITTEQYNALLADNDSYILHTVGFAVMRLARAVKVEGAQIGSLQYQKFIGSIARTITIQASGAWEKTETTYQSTSGKTTSLSASSTDNQYPSAKAAYDNDQTTLTDAKSYTDTAIANAITTALNTAV